MNKQEKKFIFFGEVDCGKSSTAGHLYVQCDGLSDHELNKIKNDCKNKQYQLWSRVLDIWEEEQEKGKTHEFNLLTLKYKEKEYSMIDTPGHKMFIRSLIEGMSYFNSSEIVGILVISVRKGEFESGWNGGQTKEDILIARSVGIMNLIVVFNKMDTINWDKKMYDKIKNTIDKFIKECRFKQVHYLPISGYDGINLVNTEGVPKQFECKMSLMETIDDIDISVNKEAQIKNEEMPDKWNQMIVNLRVLNAPNIITPGFQCVMHYLGQEYEVMFGKFKNKKMLKDKESDTVIIKSKTSVLNNKEKELFNKRVLFRSNDSTIGFGLIDKVN